MNEYEKMVALLMSVRGTPAFPIVLKEAFDGLILAEDLKALYIKFVLSEE